MRQHSTTRTIQPASSVHCGAVLSAELLQLTAPQRRVSLNSVQRSAALLCQRLQSGAAERSFTRGVALPCDVLPLRKATLDSQATAALTTPAPLPATGSACTRKRRNYSVAAVALEVCEARMATETAAVALAQRQLCAASSGALR